MLIKCILTAFESHIKLSPFDEIMSIHVITKVHRPAWLINVAVAKEEGGTELVTYEVNHRHEVSKI